jgi:undecaprenyl-diphosphatase
MNGFDKDILEFVNRFANHSHAFDKGVGLVSGSYLLKGGVFMAAVWWAWFSGEAGEDRARLRTFLISTLMAAVVALGVARVLGTVLPFRERPMFANGLDFVAPSSSRASDFEHWSSFPSDHAALFFALATGLWYVRRSVGVIAFVYSVIVICLPRLYLGVHYPTDLIAGAAIGIAVTWIAVRRPLRRAVGLPALEWLNRSPAWFYALLFLITFQIATLFADVRGLLHLFGDLR